MGDTKEEKVRNQLLIGSDSFGEKHMGPLEETKRSFCLYTDLATIFFWFLAKLTAVWTSFCQRKLDVKMEFSRGQEGEEGFRDTTASEHKNQPAKSIRIFRLCDFNAHSHANTTKLNKSLG